MKKEVIAYKDPKSPVSEMFRTLRTNLQFMNTDDELQTILITSTLPGEGKSWVASNLAVTFAQTGKNVILIDADMRKGRLYTIFEVSPRPGLSNYLSGVVNSETNKRADDIEEFIQQTEMENLSVISAGNVPPNPSELLVSHKMTRLINQLKEKFDIVIFDCTPSLLVTDAIILSRLVDMTLLVTAHKETKIDNIDKVKRTIENVGGKVAGVVVNKIPMSGKKYEDAYYYGNRNKSKNNKKNKPTIESKAIEEIAKAGTTSAINVSINDTIVPPVKTPIKTQNVLKNTNSIQEVEQKNNNKVETSEVESLINDNKDVSNGIENNALVESKVIPPVEKKQEPTSMVQSIKNNYESISNINTKTTRTTKKRKSAISDTTVRRTIKSVDQDINEINSIIEETMSESKKRKRKSKEPDRSKDILNQINKYLDKD